MSYLLLIGPSDSKMWDLQVDTVHGPNWNFWWLAFLGVGGRGFDSIIIYFSQYEDHVLALYDLTFSQTKIILNERKYMLHFSEKQNSTSIKINK